MPGHYLLRTAAKDIEGAALAKTYIQLTDVESVFMPLESELGRRPIYHRLDDVLFELIAHRYESGSLLITSNHPFSAWASIFPDNMMAVAAVDRLVHHADIIKLTGESYRKRSQVAQKRQQ